MAGKLDGTKLVSITWTAPNENAVFGVGLSVAAIIGVLFYAAITQGGDWLSGSLERGISAALKVNGTEPDTH